MTIGGHETEVATQTRLVLDAVRAAQGPDGRLPTPDAEALGDIFPFEGDLVVKAVDAPTLPEPPRGGEDAKACPLCATPDDDYLWVDDRWRLDVLPPLEGAVVEPLRRAAAQRLAAAYGGSAIG